MAQAASAAGVSARAVRLYEAKGLIGPAVRAANGYRVFEQGDVERLRFVRRARALGLSLDATAAILDAAAGGVEPCYQACELLDQRIAEIDAAVSDLLALRESIVAARHRVPGADDPPARWCPVIEQGSGASSRRA